MKLCTDRLLLRKTLLANNESLEAPNSWTMISVGGWYTCISSVSDLRGIESRPRIVIIKERLEACIKTYPCIIHQCDFLVEPASSHSSRRSAFPPNSIETASPTPILRGRNIPIREERERERESTAELLLLNQPGIFLGQLWLSGII